MEKIEIMIPLEPITKKNSQRMVRNHTTGKMYPVPSAAYKNYEMNAGYFIGKYKDIKIDIPINLKIIYYLGTRRKADLTNLQEATCDLLTFWGVLEDDNYRVVAAMDGSRVRYDKDNPRAEITITELKE